MAKNKLSVVLATKNEEGNIDACLESIKNIADEIVVYDEYSEDKTREIAKRYGARVFKYKHKKNFHETKQHAIDKATGDWILQLDADERVSPALAREIMEIINSSDEKRSERVLTTDSPFIFQNPDINLFRQHQKLIEEREGHLGKPTGEVVAFFVTRRNFFLGKPLIHGGVYPDGVIRLIRRGKARLPSINVHEVMEVDGEVGWLFNDLEHHDSPTFNRYLKRWNRYTDLIAKDFETQHLSTNALFLIHYSFTKPFFEFMKLYLRHKGILDGFRGFVWSLFSALRFPVSYFKYWQKKRV
jgi:glycosyltransferase involved in cell wall biosynthesis